MFFAPYPPVEAFDALLFIDKTTAARKVDSPGSSGVR
jgi:hypothetical protein